MMQVKVFFFFLSILNFGNGEAVAASTAQCLVKECQDCGAEQELCESFVDNAQVDFITESSYTPPRNLTFPAPKMGRGLGEDLGKTQIIDTEHKEEILNVLDEARFYMDSNVVDDEKLQDVFSICKLKHEHCAYWAAIGECEKNPGYMTVNCAPVCKSCEMLSIESRCPLDPDAQDAWYPGDIDKTFKRITEEPVFQKYGPVVLSHPPEGPWMVMLENFLTDEEADRLIELGGLEGYERSTDVGKRLADGTYDKSINGGRTSTNAWCINECEKDPIAQRIVARIENITGIPQANSENLQLLRYEEGQFYQTHNDYIPYHVERQCGVRILTFYMYLNEVFEGGGTNFPNIGITATPKRGRVVIWPSVLDDQPNVQDSRTNHQAMPVIKGVKFGANAWVHQRDFKTPNRNGCT